MLLAGTSFATIGRTLADVASVAATAESPSSRHNPMANDALVERALGRIMSLVDDLNDALRRNDEPIADMPRTLPFTPAQPKSDGMTALEVAADIHRSLSFVNEHKAELGAQNQTPDAKRGTYIYSRAVVEAWKNSRPKP